jgi:hypothetical protein
VIRQIEIAGVTLSIESNDFEWDFEDDSHYRDFEVVGKRTDVHVGVNWNPAGIEDLGDEVFSARDMPGRFPPNWRLYRSGLGWWNLEVNASPYPLIRRRVAVFRPDFRRGDVYVDLRHRDLDVFPYPLCTPLDRVLFVHLVTHGLGVMIHACGIVLDGKGYLFAGPSNAGKTTLSRLWAQATDATILGDECLILRKRDGKFWIYGTPWVGEAGLYSPSGASVEKVFFLHHARKDLVTALPPEQAAEQLLAQSILTPHDAFAIQYGLDLCLDFVGGVPAFQFGFVPERSAVQLIQRLVGNA